MSNCENASRYIYIYIYIYIEKERKTNALRDSRNMYRQLNKNMEYVLKKFNYVYVTHMHLGRGMKHTCWHILGM